MVLIYLVMVALFRSLHRSADHPRGRAARMDRHGPDPAFVTNTSVNVESMIGTLMMMGIVVSNSILLVDFANRMVRHGATAEHAVLEAGRRRIRPILMTALATILGLLPLALGFGEGNETMVPLARAVVGGLAVSTIMTLLVVPVMHCLVLSPERCRWIILRRPRRRGGNLMDEARSVSSDPPDGRRWPAWLTVSCDRARRSADILYFQHNRRTYVSRWTSFGAIHRYPSKIPGPRRTTRRWMCRPQKRYAAIWSTPSRSRQTFRLSIKPHSMPRSPVTEMDRSGQGRPVRKDQVVAVIDAPEVEEQYQQAVSDYKIKRLTHERLAKVWKESPDVIAKQDVDVAEAAYQGARHLMEQRVNCATTQKSARHTRATSPRGLPIRRADSDRDVVGHHGHSCCSRSWI